MRVVVEGVGEALSVRAMFDEGATEATLTFPWDTKAGHVVTEEEEAREGPGPP